MKILITGAAGFVGRRLAAALAGAGHEIVALVKREIPGADRYYFASERIRVLVADVTRLDMAALPSGVEAVYTLAQSSMFRDFPARAEEIFKTNVTASLRLLEWARQAGVRKFVHASSGGIYGGRLDARFQEADLLAVDSPLGFYLGTKLCSEVLFQNYRQFFETAVILRPFFIYGPGQRRDMFVTRIIESVAEGRPVSLQGRDGLKINPVYVDDAVQAFVNSLAVDGCRIFNVAGPSIVTLRELAQLIAARVGRAPVFQVDEAAQPVDYVATTTQAARALGAATTTLERGIALTLGSRARPATPPAG